MPKGKNKQTGNKRPSPKTSKAASDVLRDDRYSDKAKTPAGYTLGDTAKKGGRKTAKKAAKRARG